MEGCNVTFISLDTYFNVTALIYKQPTKDRYAPSEKNIALKEISNTLENSGDIMLFENMSIKKEVSDNEYLVFNYGGSKKNINLSVGVNIDNKSQHPLESEYGTFGLKLREVGYRERRTMSKTITADSSLTYIVDYAEFDIKGKPNQTLRLSSKELFKYVLSMSMSYRGSVSDEFYSNQGSGLGIFSIDNGLPVVFGIGRDIKTMYPDVKLVKSTKYKRQLDNWKNKMLILGQPIECSETSYIKYGGNNERITIPNVLLLEPTVFQSSPVKEAVVTDPETIVHPDNKLAFIEPYQNRYGTKVKIIKSYDASLDKPLLFREPDNVVVDCLIRQAFVGFRVNVLGYISGMRLKV
jgi:hypothetical protein